MSPRTWKQYKASKRKSAAYWRDKVVALEAYGGRCTCCGESEPSFLTFDHLEGGGGAHRRQDSLARKNISRWLIEQGYPPEFQILCMNCHHAIDNGPGHLQGKCPHRIRVVPIHDP